MAARKNYRLKLKHAAHLRRLSERTTEEGRSMKELVMASVSDHLSQSPPTEPLTSFNFGHPSSLPSQHVLSHPSAPMTTSVAPQRRRKTPKHSINSLKRSSSTPNVRGDSAMSMADKRRNKLGYHRTSVACGTFLARSCTSRIAERFR